MLRSGNIECSSHKFFEKIFGVRTLQAAIVVNYQLYGPLSGGEIGDEAILIRNRPIQVWDFFSTDISGCNGIRGLKKRYIGCYLTGWS